MCLSTVAAASGATAAAPTESVSLCVLTTFAKKGGMTETDTVTLIVEDLCIRVNF